MDLRTVTAGAGVLGGICWLARLVLDVADVGDGTPVDVLHWAGLVLIAVAMAGVGAGLVGREVWLQAVVAVAFPLLVWSVLEVLHPAGDPAVIDGVFAVLVLAICARRLLQHREREPSRHHGTHAR